MGRKNLQAISRKKDRTSTMVTKEEADESYWDYQPVLLILDDGTTLCPMSDDEGNNAGSLCHLGGEQETIPVMRF